MSETEKRECWDTVSGKIARLFEDFRKARKGSMMRRKLHLPHDDMFLSLSLSLFFSFLCVRVYVFAAAQSIESDRFSSLISLSMLDDFIKYFSSF